MKLDILGAKSIAHFGVNSTDLLLHDHDGVSPLDFVLRLIGDITMIYDFVPKCRQMLVNTNHVNSKFVIAASASLEHYCNIISTLDAAYIRRVFIWREFHRADTNVKPLGEIPIISACTSVPSRKIPLRIYELFGNKSPTAADIVESLYGLGIIHDEYLVAEPQSMLTVLRNLMLNLFDVRKVFSNAFNEINTDYLAFRDTELRSVASYFKAQIEWVEIREAELQAKLPRERPSLSLI